MNYIKKSKIFLLIIVLLFSLCVLVACNGEIEDKEDLTLKNDALNKEIALLKNELSDLKESYEDLKDDYDDIEIQLWDYQEVYGYMNLNESKEVVDDSTESTNDFDDDNDLSGNIKEIKIGENVKIDDYASFTVNSINFTQKVKPSNPQGYYSYYEVSDPKEVYIDTVIDIKNESTISLKPSDMIDVKILYADKYNYYSFTVAEESGGGDIDSFLRLSPLTEAKTHSLATVPLEVRDSGASVDVIITIYNNVYKIKAR